MSHVKQRSDDDTAISKGKCPDCNCTLKYMPDRSYKFCPLCDEYFEIIGQVWCRCKGASKEYDRRDRENAKAFRMN